MKAWLLVLLVACVVADQQFDQFLNRFGKHYEGAEYTRRLAIYRHNIKKAAILNKGNNVFGETKFSDLSEEEFKSTFLMPGVPAADLAEACLIAPDYLPNPLHAAPTSYDWTTNAEVVLPVKNQQSCGSCWAFSTAEAIEGQVGVAGLYSKVADSLSPKYIVDCSAGCTSEIYMKRNTTVCNDGCNGGWPWSAFDDIANKASTTYIGPIPTETAVPYIFPWDTTCPAKTGVTVGITGYTCLTTGSMSKAIDENTMVESLYSVGPLSIALNANYFSYYTGGIMNIAACTGGVLNHAVLLVGYGTDGTTPYWKVKNSWGADWGEAGYIRIYRGSDMCGIAEAVSYPNGVFVQ